MLWRVIYDYYLIAKKSKKMARREGNIFDNCVADTIDGMSFAANAIFIRKGFDIESSKKLAKTITRSIKEAFTQNYLKNRIWLDEDTRIAIKDKVDAMTTWIGIALTLNQAVYINSQILFICLGYPEFILNSTKLDEFYGGLIMEPNTYFKNNLRLRRFLFQKKLLSIGRIFDKNE